MESDSKPSTPQQQSRWLRFRGASTDTSPDKGKGKQNQPKALTGATVVRKPLDAFKDGPANKADD